MVNLRLSQSKLAGRAYQGSILSPEFDAGTFDAIVAIGCLHHTGDLFGAIDSCMNLLKPGGRLTFMVYYAYSYRRWKEATVDTLKYMSRELFLGRREAICASDSNQAALYDKSSSGEGAPHTDWISKRSLHKMCSGFADVTMCVENIDVFPGLKSFTRERLLKTAIPSVMGLDIYVTAIK